MESFRACSRLSLFSPLLPLSHSASLGQKRITFSGKKKSDGDATAATTAAISVLLLLYPLEGERERERLGNIRYNIQANFEGKRRLSLRSAPLLREQNLILITLKVPRVLEHWKARPTGNRICGLAAKTGVRLFSVSPRRKCASQDHGTGLFGQKQVLATQVLPPPPPPLSPLSHLSPLSRTYPSISRAFRCFHSKLPTPAWHRGPCAIFWMETKSLVELHPVRGGCYVQFQCKLESSWEAAPPRAIHWPGYLTPTHARRRRRPAAGFWTNRREHGCLPASPRARRQRQGSRSRGLQREREGGGKTQESSHSVFVMARSTLSKSKEKRTAAVQSRGRAEGDRARGHVSASASQAESINFRPG